MVERCPYNCYLKNERGYCTITGCINQEVLQEKYRYFYYPFVNNNACTYCSNNPKNGGGGVCHCILGGMIWN